MGAAGLFHALYDKYANKTEFEGIVSYRSDYTSDSAVWCNDPRQEAFVGLIVFIVKCECSIVVQVCKAVYGGECLYWDLIAFIDVSEQ